MLRKGLRESSPEAETFGLEEAIAKISTKVMSPKTEDLSGLTDLTPNEIFSLSYLSIYAEVFGSEIIKAWIEEFKRNRISRLRTGRKEGLMLGVGAKEDEKVKGRGLGDFFNSFK